MLSDLIWAPFPMETWTRWSFAVPPNLGRSVSVRINICPTLFFLPPTHIQSEIWEQEGPYASVRVFFVFFFLLSVPVSIYFC